MVSLELMRKVDAERRRLAAIFFLSTSFLFAFSTRSSVEVVVVVMMTGL